MLRVRRPKWRRIIVGAFVAAPAPMRTRGTRSVKADAMTRDLVWLRGVDPAAMREIVAETGAVRPIVAARASSVD